MTIVDRTVLSPKGALLKLKHEQCISKKEYHEIDAYIPVGYVATDWKCRLCEGSIKLKLNKSHYVLICKCSTVRKTYYTD